MRARGRSGPTGCDEREPGVGDRVGVAVQAVLCGLQALRDRGGDPQAVRTDRVGVLEAIHRGLQDGQVTRAPREAQLGPVMNRMNRVLLEGAILGTDPAVVKFCENVLALEPAR